MSMQRNAALAAHARLRLLAIDGLELHAARRPGAVSFVLRQQPAAAVVAVLVTEFGIDARHRHGLGPDRVWLQLGPRHTFADVDALAEALQKIARGEFEGVYIHDADSGDYVALGAPQRTQRAA